MLSRLLFHFNGDLSAGTLIISFPRSYPPRSALQYINGSAVRRKEIPPISLAYAFDMARPCVTVPSHRSHPLMTLTTVQMTSTDGSESQRRSALTAYNGQPSTSHAFMRLLFMLISIERAEGQARWQGFPFPFFTCQHRYRGIHTP